MDPVKPVEHQAYWSQPPQNIPKKADDQDLFDFKQAYEEPPAVTSENQNTPNQNPQGW